MSTSFLEHNSYFLADKQTTYDVNSNDLIISYNELKNICIVHTILFKYLIIRNNKLENGRKNTLHSLKDNFWLKWIKLKVLALNDTSVDKLSMRWTVRMARQLIGHEKDGYEFKVKQNSQ